MAPWHDMPNILSTISRPATPNPQVTTPTYTQSHSNFGLEAMMAADDATHDAMAAALDARADQDLPPDEVTAL